jgi:hypothetical protein
MQDGLTQRLAKRVLSNDKYALIAVVVCMLLPYSAWLSMTVLSLVTLRKGWKQGSMLLIPAVTANILVSLTSVALTVALIDALARVLPCYLAACVLRSYSSWKAVALFFMGLIGLFALSLQLVAPTLIEAQYVYLQTVLREVDAWHQLMGVLEEQGIASFIVANYLIGFQFACLFFATATPLLFARSIQSQLYYPGGFQQELRDFRGDKQSVIVLVLLCFAAYQGHVLAMNCLPLLVLYFVLAGLCVSVHVLASMKPWKVAILLMVPFLCLPQVFLPLYVFLGACDGLFNFRLYLPARAGKIT